MGRDYLEEIASMKPTVLSTTGKTSGNGHVQFDLAGWIDEQGIRVRREGEWEQGGYRWVLEECPWNGHADRAAFIVRLPGGGIAAGCHHNSCQGKGWRELREHYEPGAYDSNGWSDARNGHRDAAYETGQSSWPELDEAAFHGLPGEIVRAMEPHSEADPVALLVSLLCAFGNAIGRKSYFRVGSDTHHLNLYAAFVGESSKARKGMSWNYVKGLLREVDEGWIENRVVTGISSGEGLIHHVRDKKEKTNKDGETEIVDEGVIDKRLLSIESELASLLKVMTRQGNTTSAIARTAWDGGKLQNLIKNSPDTATGAHVSIIGHITKNELLRHLTETEAGNGFANRFLWFLVRRSKELPFGGEWHTVDMATLAERLHDALRFARYELEVTWGESAREGWRAAYSELSEGKPGMFGAVTGRAEAQTIRLAALYAVLDKSRTVEYQHLEAALALWQYAEESARYIFGDATGDPEADAILDALRAAGSAGMTRTGIRDLFQRNKSTERINQALSLLLKMGKARQVSEETGGRPTERWFAS